MKRMAFFLMMAVTLVLASSCDFKEIDEAGTGRMCIDFDFSNVENEPKTMKIFFYPVGGYAVDMIKQGYTTMDWTADNKKVTLPEGVYNITAFSLEGDHVFYTNETKRETLRLLTDRYTFGETTRAAKSPLQIVDSIYNGQELLFAPDFVVKANEELSFVDCYVPEQSLTLYADSLTTTVQLKIKGVGGLQFVTECEGVLGGLMKYGNPTPDGVVADSTVMGFPMVIDAENNELNATFQVWGMEPYGTEWGTQHKLTLFFWMDDAKVFVPVDITEDIKKAPNNGGVVVVNLTLDINVRESTGGSSGFEIELDPWEDVNIDIGM